MLEQVVRRPVLVNMLMLTVVVFGILYYRANIKEQMPEVPINAAWIETIHAGVAARDIEALITRPIEAAIDGVEGIDYINSSSYEGRSFIWVEFKADIPNVAKSVIDLQTQVNQISDLPEDIDPPRVGQAKVRMPALTVTLRADGHHERVLRRVGLELEERLERIKDVGKIWVSGIRQREISVVVDPARLRAHGLSVDQVVAALSQRKRDVPGGNIVYGRHEYTLRGLAELRSLAEIEGIVLRPDPSGAHVLLRDVARVEDSFSEARTAARVDGRPGVVLTVMKEYGGDILALSSAVRERLHAFAKKLPAGMDVKLIGDGAHAVRASLRTLYTNGLLGMLLVLICLWLSLGLRNAVMASLGLPVALLGAAAAMYFLGVTINIVALFALILCVGIVVDDAIVIIENIYRHLEQGSPPLRAAVEGTREVLWPVVSSVLTTCAAFLPLLLMTGVLGEYFSIIPKVVVAALSASLLEALVILPSHMADLGRLRGRGAGQTPRPRLQRVQRRLAAAKGCYLALLRWALRRPVRVSLATLGLCAALVAAAFATKEIVLLADEDIQLFDVRVQMPRGVTLQRTTDVLKQIEERALELPQNEVEAVISIAGWSRTRLWPQSGKHLGMVSIILAPAGRRGRRGQQVMEQLRGKLSEVVGPINTELAGVTFKPPTGRPVAVRISGDRFESLKRIADKVKQRLRRIPGAVSVSDDFELGKRELRVRVDAQRAALHGLQHSSVARFVRAVYGGIVATEFRDNNEELDVVVRYDKAVRRDPAGLPALRVETPSGRRVALSDIATVERGRDISAIRRRDRQRTITVTADVAQDVSTSSAINRRLRRDIAPLVAANPEVRFVLGGEWEKTAESLGSLFRAFSVAALLIFAILAAQFRSIVQPLAVLLAIPLSLIGVVTGFFVSGEPIGMIALVGVVGLAGIAVNDATVLIDFVNVRRRQGTSLEEALLSACVLRLRPVLLTSVTTIAGLLPLALAWGGAAESLRPMAVAIVWGLGFCTILTLLVVPCLYLCVTRLGARLVPPRLRAAINQHPEG